jgi:carboxymethylenebutenolidase
MAPEWDRPEGGFRAALAFYPGCRLKGRFDETPLRPYAPVLILHGTDDEEVSHEHCLDLVEASHAAGGTIEIELYEGATHGFDSPTSSRQSLAANRGAAEKAESAALDFFARHLQDKAAPPGQRNETER